MKWGWRFLLLFLALGTLGACASTRSEPVEGATVAATHTARLIRVADVTNDTHELFNVDVIGLLWTGLDESLAKRGLLWKGDPAASPLKIYAKVVKYQKGNMVLRSLLPYWGKTKLLVRCELRDGDRVLATAESEQSVSIGSGSLTFDASRKIFSAAAQELVDQLSRKI